jgi:hypothetical protein
MPIARLLSPAAKLLTDFNPRIQQSGATRTGAQLCAPMRSQAPVANHYTAPENRLVAVIVTGRVIVVAPIRVIAVVVIGWRRIIRRIRSRIIITGVIRRHVRALRTPAQKSCDDAAAEQ